MTRAPTIRFPIEPRLIPPAKVARRLGLTPSTFATKLPELVAAGFPQADPLLGNYCLQAVDDWITARAGLSAANDSGSAQSEMLRAVRSKAWAR